METAALIGLGVLSVFGIATWPVMWTGRVPPSLRDARQGWRYRLRMSLEQMSRRRTDAAVVLIVCGLFVGLAGLRITERGDGLTTLGDGIAITGYSLAGVFGLLAVSVALFGRPKLLIPPDLRGEVHQPDAEPDGRPRIGRKLLVVAAGFVAASVVPMALGIHPSRSLIIGAGFAGLFLLACLLPLVGTTVFTVLAVVVMVLFLPRHPVDELPLRGFEFAWGALAITVVINLAWHWLDRLRRRLRRRS